MLLDLNKISDKIHEWSEDMERVPVLGKFVHKSKTLTLPGFQKIPLYDVMRFFMQSLGKGVVFQRAAAITYRIFAALIPMIIGLFTVIAYLGDNIQQTLLDFLESAVPTYVWPAIQNMITEVVTRQYGALTSFMFVIGIYFTIVMINSLLVAMNTSYFNEKRRNVVKQILLSAVVMLIFFAVIVLVLGLFIAASVIMRYVHTHIFGTSTGYYIAVHGVKWLLTFIAIYFLISILYYLAPVEKTNYRFFSAGSSMATISMVILLWFLNVYFSNFTNYNLIYGSLGALFAVLLWINWNAIILLVGYDLNVSIAKAKMAKAEETIAKENNV
ncbi:MAG: YihY/virulence factor BrkB family protein [Bacteroidales bacterium]|nr:YihY/virulence factor BrkB family protein [Bacteroidales bacterium]MBO7647296.1 YihY/virulence factor BrkB family protein [Bacteroidales bacterium]